MANEHHAVLDALRAARERADVPEPDPTEREVSEAVSQILRAARSEGERMVRDAEAQVTSVLRSAEEQRAAVAAMDESAAHERAELLADARRQVDQLLAQGLDRYHRLQAIHSQLRDQLLQAEQGIRVLRKAFEAATAQDRGRTAPSEPPGSSGPSRGQPSTQQHLP